MRMHGLYLIYPILNDGLAITSMMSDLSCITAITDIYRRENLSVVLQ